MRLATTGRPSPTFNDRLRAIAHAAVALERDGLRVIDAGYQTAEGTLDLVAYQRGPRTLLVVCQVTIGSAAPPDAARWRRMARQWIDDQHAHQPPVRVRFDAITVDLHRLGGLQRLHHRRDIP